MFKDLRRFARMFDAVLDSERTKQKTDAVFACMKKQRREEAQAQLDAVEEKKENSQFYKDLLLASIPQIAELFKAMVEDMSPKKHEIHVSRAPVVVDRDEQGSDPDRVQPENPAAGATPPADKTQDAEKWKMLEAALVAMKNALGDLNKRLTMVETTGPMVADLSNRLANIEAAQARVGTASAPSADSSAS